VRSSFEAFIETKLMVQSEFNLIFWFVSYNIFLMKKSWHVLLRTLFLLMSRACGRPPERGPVADELFHGKYRG
jgi:hypothetical protein